MLRIGMMALPRNGPSSGGSAIQHGSRRRCIDPGYLCFASGRKSASSWKPPVVRMLPACGFVPGPQPNTQDLIRHDIERPGNCASGLLLGESFLLVPLASKRDRPQTDVPLLTWLKEAQKSLSRVWSQRRSLPFSTCQYSRF